MGGKGYQRTERAGVRASAGGHWLRGRTLALDAMAMGVGCRFVSLRAGESIPSERDGLK